MTFDTMMVGELALLFLIVAVWAATTIGTLFGVMVMVVAACLHAPVLLVWGALLAWMWMPVGPGGGGGGRARFT